MFFVYTTIHMHPLYDVLIAGAGFGGVRLAQEAVKKGLKVCVVSDKSYFEYYPAMYRIVTGAPYESVALSLADIRHSQKITWVNDHITSIDIASKTITCASGATYSAAALVIALGVTNSYFGIPGMEEYSFGFKSIGKAMHLHERVHELFERNSTASVDEQLLAFHFVIAGGGVSGVELAGELSYYTKLLAKKYKVPLSCISIDIVESNPTLVPMLPVKAQQKITKHLTKLGVRILCNRRVVESQAWTVHLSDMVIAAKTVIWAAGVAPHPLVQNTAGLPLNDKNRIKVNEYLEVTGFSGVYAIGDCADTKFSGLAQTALQQGEYVAAAIFAQKNRNNILPYAQAAIAYDVPIGWYWGVLVYKDIVIAGMAPWLLRFFIDVRFYISVLPCSRVLKIIFAILRPKIK